MRNLSPSRIWVFGALLLSIANARAESIRIGFVNSFSGSEAAEGEVHLKALKLAVKQLNAGGGIKGQTVEIVQGDSKSSPKGALDAFDEVVDRGKVFAVIGPNKSPQVLALVPRGMQKEVPMFFGGTTAKLTTEGSRWLFRVRASDTIFATAMAKYAAEAFPGKKLGILSENNAFGNSGANLVAKALAEQHLSLTTRVTFATGNESQRAAGLQALKDAGTEIGFVYVSTYDDMGRLILRWKEMGKPFVFFGSPAALSSPAMALARDAAGGLYAGMDFVPGATVRSRKYVDDYRREYRDDPNPTSVYAYDSMNILARAIGEAGLDRTKVRDYIVQKMKDFEGVMGTYSFNAQGEGLREVNIVKVVDGKPQLIKAASGG